MIAYLLLAAAIACEIVATLCLKASEGFSRAGPSVLVVIGYVSSFTLLGLALNRGLPVSLGYAIWAAVGTTIVALLGVMFFHESLSATAIVGLVLIVSGVALLNIGGAGHGPTSAAPAHDVAPEHSDSGAAGGVAAER